MSYREQTGHSRAVAEAPGWIERGMRECPEWEPDGGLTCAARFTRADWVGLPGSRSWYDCTRTIGHEQPHIAHGAVFEHEQIASVRVCAVGVVLDGR